MPVLRQQRLLEPAASVGSLSSWHKAGLCAVGALASPAACRACQRSAQGLRKSTLRQDGDFWPRFGGSPSEPQGTAGQALTHCSSGLFFCR